MSNPWHGFEADIVREEKRREKQRFENMIQDLKARDNHPWKPFIVNRSAKLIGRKRQNPRG